MRCALLLLLAIPAGAQGLPEITDKAIVEHIKWMAHDKRGGRAACCQPLGHNGQLPLFALGRYGRFQPHSGQPAVAWRKS